MSYRKAPSISRSENYTDTPSTITIRPPNEQKTKQPMIQHDRKITQILLKNRLHLSSIRDEDEAIRMFLYVTMFKLLNKQVPGMQKLKKLLCGNLNTSSLDGLTEMECKNKVQEVLTESVGLPPIAIERELLQMFNSERSYDRYLVGTIRKKIENDYPKTQDVQKLLEKETSVKIEILDINDPLRQKADLLISKEGRIFKRSVREQDDESEGQSLHSQPKGQDQIMELTLSKISSTRQDKQPEEIVVTEFKAPPQKSKSFWDIICCSE